MKLIAPRIEEIPAKCNEKMAKLTLWEGWNIAFERGGYTVHPVPAPTDEKEEINKNLRAGGKSQKLILFIRGKAISGADVIIGTNQFPNPPIMIGITMKKIITKAWAVTITLYSWSICENALKWDNLIRIKVLIENPKIPAHTPKIKYIVPISLWFVEYNHFIKF